MDYFFCLERQERTLYEAHVYDLLNNKRENVEPPIDHKGGSADIKN